MPAEKTSTNVRREQIAQAALDLVASQGLQTLSIGAVARRVGLTPSGIYRHFKGKDEVLDEVQKLVQDRLTKNVKAVREKTEDAVEQLHQLLLRHVALIRQNQGIARVVFSDSFYADRPERRTRTYRSIRQYLDEVAAIIRQGQENGRISHDFAPETAAVMFLGLIQPSAILWHMSGGQFDVTRQAERAWPIFRKAIEKQNH